VKLIRWPRNSLISNGTQAVFPTPRLPPSALPPKWRHLERTARIIRISAI